VSQQPSIPRSHDGVAVGRRLAAALVTVVTVVAAVAQALGVPGTLSAVQRSVATLLLTLAFVQCLNSGLRVKLRHLRDPGLRLRLVQELVLCGAVPAVVGTVGWVWEPSGVGLLLLTLPVVGVSLVVDSLETTIARRVERARLRPVTAYIAGCEVYGRLSGSGRSLGESVEDASAGEVARLIARLLQPLPRHAMSRARVLMTTLILAAWVMQAGVGLAGVIVPPAGKHSRSGGHDGGGGGGGTGSRGSGGGGQGSGGSLRLATGPLSQAERTWERRCPSSPGEGAPWWAATQLYVLYLGPADNDLPPEATGPPGIVGGCTGPVVAPQADEAFVYAAGIDFVTGDEASIAVDSLLYGPALFLAPAVGAVKALVRDGAAVGGSHRITVGRGDFYAVYANGGTTMLIRPQYWEDGGASVPQAYTQLPPAVTDAWFDTMMRVRTWLWPIEHVGRDGTTFELVDDMIHRRVVATVDYDPTALQARRWIGSEELVFGPGGILLPEAVLLRWARTAP
jgi:uncharacterized membrane protein YgcG